MTNPRRLGQRELDLINRFVNCNLEMSPRAFEAKWDVKRSHSCALCHCSITTVQRWFERGSNYCYPTRHHKRSLALADIFMECFEEFPESLRNRFCPPP